MYVFHILRLMHTKLQRVKYLNINVGYYFIKVYFIERVIFTYYTLLCIHVIILFLLGFYMYTPLCTSH